MSLYNNECCNCSRLQFVLGSRLRFTPGARVVGTVPSVASVLRIGDVISDRKQDSLSWTVTTTNGMEIVTACLRQVSHNTTIEGV